MSVISQTDVEAYANDGVLLIKSLLTLNEVSDLREEIDANISNPSSSDRLPVMKMITDGSLRIFAPGRKTQLTEG